MMSCRKADAADCLAEGVEPGRLRAMLATAEAWLEVEVQRMSRHQVATVSTTTANLTGQ